MAELKTKVNDNNVYEFIENYCNDNQKKIDSYNLITFFEEITGYKAKMWGSSIIGFGSYHYKSERSSQEGDWPIVGFSPRKNAISLYVYSGTKKQDELIKGLGKYKMGKSCIYIKSLHDINLEVLKEIILESIKLHN